jgi:hypothetical protein
MRKRIFLSTALVVLAAVSVLLSQPLTDTTKETDPVLKFYVHQADSTFEKTDFSDSTLKYSFLAFTYYKNIGRKGVVSRLDSAVTRYFCSGVKIDSTQTVVASHRKIPEITFDYPNVFTCSFEHRFFPNDVGEINLAIGFDNYTAKDTLPTGIAVVDRENYALHRLYLYYPNAVDYKRLTRSFRFAQFSGLVFPDSIWEVGARQGIFTVEYYRLETEIGQLQFIK